jgi:CTP synthase
MLHEQGLDGLICSRLGLETGEADLTNWLQMLSVLNNPEHSTEVAVVGKYIERQSAYESIYESLQHGGIANRARVRIRRLDSEQIQSAGAAAALEGVHGVLVPGGFGTRGVQGKIMAARYARENAIPYFGICLGMQCAAIEFARNVCGLERAQTTEIERDTPEPVISLLEEQRSITEMGGTMRLGAQECVLVEGTRAHACYKADRITERHRHRYEFNNQYRDMFAKGGMTASGVNPRLDLVEILELRDHPWFVGVQFHPEFKSKPTAPHPLFAGFIAAALRHQQEHAG